MYQSYTGWKEITFVYPIYSQTEKMNCMINLSLRSCKSLYKNLSIDRLIFCSEISVTS